MKLISTSTLDWVQRFVSSIPHVTPKIAISHLSIFGFSADAIDAKSVFPPPILSNLHRNEAQLYIESSVERKDSSNREQGSPVRWGRQTSLSLKKGSALFTKQIHYEDVDFTWFRVGVGVKSDLALRDNICLTSLRQILSLDIEIPLD
ncbi:hypothetical protein TNCV_4059601 [Trichonephila clavipes]|nr:hypothetical protein TNCV_4059601 [Trichonephila clavipes]